MDFIYCTERKGGNTPFLNDNIVFMDGEILTNDHIKFKDLINKYELFTKNKVKVYINSFGGNFLESLKIGNLIKKYEFDTYFSSEKYSLYNKENEKEIFYTGSNNFCYSAANFIFISGKKREIYKINHNSWGSHRLSSINKIIGINTIQEILYQLIIFLNKSKVSLDFLNYFLKDDDLSHINLKELKSLNIINNDNEREKFIICKKNNKNAISIKLKNRFDNCNLTITKIKDRYIFKYLLNNKINRIDNSISIVINKFFIRELKLKHINNKSVIIGEIHINTLYEIIKNSKRIKICLAGFSNSEIHNEFNCTLNEKKVYIFYRLLKSI